MIPPAYTEFIGKHLLAEIERLTKALTLLAHNVECFIIGHKYDEFVCTRCGRNAFDA